MTVTVNESPAVWVRDYPCPGRATAAARTLGDLVPGVRSREVGSGEISTDPARDLLYRSAMTKADWYRAAREIYAAALEKDEPFTNEVAIAVIGGAVFAWDQLSTAQLRTMHRHLFATARLA